MIKQFLLLISIIVFSTSFSQSRLIDTSKFEMNDEIVYKNVTLKFWFFKDTETDDNDTLKNRLIVEKIIATKHTIIFNEQMRDGEFDLIDINKDGVKDLVGTYHDYYVVHLLNVTTLNYEKEFQLPMHYELLNKKECLFYCYCEPQWGIRKPYSTLYTLKSNKLYCYYIIEYVEEDFYNENSNIKSIKIYKIINGNIVNKKLMESISGKLIKTFDYKKYWEKNYKRLLNLK